MQASPQGEGQAAPSPKLPYVMTLTTRPEGDRVVVVLRGAIDWEDEEALRRALLDALGRTVRGIDLDLKEVSFWDCSGLNVLLAVRRVALLDGKTVVLRATSPVVDRVLELTDTLALFTVGAEQ
jgi:anti-anti-sigma factor